MKWLHSRVRDRTYVPVVCTAVEAVVEPHGLIAECGRIASDGDCGAVVHDTPDEWLEWLFGLAVESRVTCVVANAASTDVPAALGLLDLESLLRARPEWCLGDALILSPKVTLLRFVPDNEDINTVDVCGSEQMFPGAEYDSDPVIAAARMAELMTERREIVERFNMGGLGKTAASQSLRILQRRVRPHTMVVTNVVEEERRVVRQLSLSTLAYGGGRREVRPGAHTGDFHMVDFDAAYARLLGMATFPVRPGNRTRATPDDLRELLADGFGVVAAVRAVPHVPAFPLRAVVDRSLDEGLVAVDVQGEGIPHAKPGEVVRYPTGQEHWMVLTTRELERQRRGDIDVLEVGECWTFAMDDHPWNEFSKITLEATEVLRGTPHETWMKSARNFLHGKFAQSFSEALSIDDDEVTRAPTGDVTWIDGIPYRRRFNRWLAEGPKRWAADTFPAASAHLTADCRLAMYDFMDCAGLENVVYVHTDGMWVNSDGLDRLGNYVGLPWRVKHSAKILIVGEQGYYCPEGRAMSGIPDSATQVEQGRYEWVGWEPYAGQITNRTIRGSVRTMKLG